MYFIVYFRQVLTKSEIYVPYKLELKVLYSSQNDRILSAYFKRFVTVERNYTLPVIPRFCNLTTNLIFQIVLVIDF